MEEAAKTTAGQHARDPVGCGELSASGGQGRNVPLWSSQCGFLSPLLRAVRVSVSAAACGVGLDSSLASESD